MKSLSTFHSIFCIENLNFMFTEGRVFFVCQTLQFDWCINKKTKLTNNITNYQRHIWDDRSNRWFCVVCPLFRESIDRWISLSRAVMTKTTFYTCTLINVDVNQNIVFTLMFTLQNVYYFIKKLTSRYTLNNTLQLFYAYKYAISYLFSQFLSNTVRLCTNKSIFVQQSIPLSSSFAKNNKKNS